MMHYTLAGTTEEATVNVADVIRVVEEANEADDFLVLIGGTASVAYENNELAESDLRNGERFGVPVALIVLLVLFGALVATFIPLGLSGVSIVVALAAVALIGQISPLLFFVQLMVVMIGLAVGIDYSLLIVLRFKEELGHGLSPREAVARTGDTAGRTVLFSGVTVVLALVGLFIVPASFYQSLALGAILVVLATLAATLTLLPAIPGVAGPPGKPADHTLYLQVCSQGRRHLRGWFLGQNNQSRNLAAHNQPAHRWYPDDYRGLVLPGYPNRAERREHLPGQGGNQEGIPADGGGVFLWRRDSGGVSQPGPYRDFRRSGRAGCAGSSPEIAAVPG